MKNKRLIISLIILLSIIVVLLIGGMIFLLSGNKVFNFINYKTSKELAINETYDMDFDSIDVNASAGDIEIKKANSNNIQVIVYGDKEDINIEIDYMNLTKDSYIKDNLGDIELGNTNEIFISAKTSLGDIKINNNYNKSDITLKIDNDCGDIKVNN